MDGDAVGNAGEFESEQALFSLLAAFYNVNPDSELLEAVNELEDDGWDDPKLQNAVELMKSQTKTVTDEEAILELKRDWTKLFRGVSPDYGPKPPYEQLFSGGDIVEVAGALAKEYADYGFGVEGERHDYIGVELGFLVHLAALADVAYKKGDTEAFDAFAEEFDNFLEDHPKRWFSKFKETSLPHASTDFYRGVLEFTDFFLAD
jgi:TorA maturation chaperone TorD